MEKNDNFLFYSGNGNHALGAKILKNLLEYLEMDYSFSHTDFGKFPDKETDDTIPKSSKIKDKTIIFYQSIFDEILLLEALQLIYALKIQYESLRLIAVIPFVIYRRQDHPEKTGEICRLKMLVHFLKSAGVDEVVTITPHSPKMEEFFQKVDIKFHEANPAIILASPIKTYLSDLLEKPILYSPDGGSIPRAIELARLINGTVLFSLKERGLNNEIEIKEAEKEEISSIIENYQEKGFSDLNYANAESISGKSIVMIEDEVSTGGTANETAQNLKKYGATGIIFLATHPVLVSGWRRKLFDNNPFDKVIMGDTIPRDYEKSTGGLIHDVSMAEPLAQALYKALKPYL